MTTFIGIVLMKSGVWVLFEIWNLGEDFEKIKLALLLSIISDYKTDYLTYFFNELSDNLYLSSAYLLGDYFIEELVDKFLFLTGEFTLLAT